MTARTSANSALLPLEHALAQMGRAVAAVSPEQRSLPTPCHDWGVAELARHVIGHGLRNFAASVRGEAVDWSAGPPVDLDEDWNAAFDAGAAHLLEAWRAANLDAPVAGAGGSAAPLRSRLDQQVAELTIHSWDLARAVGSDTSLDDDLAERSLAWSRAMLKPEYRGPDKAFGHEVTVGPDASPYEQLAAWFGRDPSWQAPPSPGPAS